MALTFPERHPEIRRVTLYMDHDLAGFVNARKIKTMLHEDKRFPARHPRQPPRMGKDYNEKLLVREQLQTSQHQRCLKRRLFQFREDFNMNGSQHIRFKVQRRKSCRFPFPTMVYSARSMETGTVHFAVCQCLDDTYAEIDGVNYSLPDFAKRMKHNQISFALA